MNRLLVALCMAFVGVSSVGGCGDGDQATEESEFSYTQGLSLARQPDDVVAQASPRPAGGPGAAAIERDAAAHWPQWRGPAGDGTSLETELPRAWSETQHVAWKTSLPGWGNSTPAVWGGAIFVTAHEADRLLLIRLDAASGRIAWERQVGRGTAPRAAGEDNSGERSVFNRLHNLASPSPVTDGEIVAVAFGNGDIAAYDFAGERLWKRNLAEDYGAFSNWWGRANSPVLYGDLVISVCMQDPHDHREDSSPPSYVVAHDKRTGLEVWKRDRPTAAEREAADAYTTPVFRHAGERAEMIVMGANRLDAYDPASGESLWQVSGLDGGRTVPSPVVGDGLIYAVAGMRGPLHAIHPGGSGDLDPAEATVWRRSGSTPDTPSAVLWKGLLFTITDNAVASCFDAGTGELHWRRRLRGENFKASPVAADGKVYFLSVTGTCTVVAAAEKFELLAENRLEDEFLASPAIAGGTLYLRGKRGLYAIGE